MSQIHSELWSELHLQCLGELISNIIKDNFLSDDEQYEMIEKREKLRILYKQLRDENDEISITTGCERRNLKIFRQVEIPINLNNYEITG